MIENTCEIFPGLYLGGVAANPTYDGPGMGPIFGGMMLFGEKAAEELAGRL